MNPIKFQLNGQEKTYVGPPMRRVLDYLREDARLTGSKEGCGEGECGLCSVLVNGESVNSCLMAMSQLQDKELWTVEGLAEKPAGKLLAQSFLNLGAAQCGICTPGMFVAGYALLQDPDVCKIKNKEQWVREGIAGNLCRCTGYQKIVDAIVQAMDGAQ